MTNVPDRLSLRCADSDRQLVADVLNTAYAEGRLTLEEHDERTTAVWSARTFGELDQLTLDLVGARPSAPAVPQPTNDRGPLVLANPGSTDQWTSIMGTNRVQGTSARLPQESTANVLMGDVIIDLSQGTLDAQTCTIHANVVMGYLKLTVPAGVDVEIRMTNIMGDTKTSGLRPGGPGSPRVVITGFCLMGDVKAYGPDHVGLGKRLGLTR